MSAATPIARNVQAEAAPLSDTAGGQAGAALQQIGDIGTDFAVAQQKAQDQADLVKVRLSGAKQIGALDDQFRTDQDPATMPARYEEATAKIGAELGKGLQGPAAAAFSEDFGMMAQAHLRNIKDVAFNRQSEQANANLDDTIETNSRAAAFAANPAERASHIATIQQGIDGLVQTGQMSAIAGQKKLQTAKEQLSLYDGDRAVMLHPAQALKDLSRADYLPDLDPLHRVELQNKADAKIKQAAREAKQDDQMARLTAAQAASDYHDVVASGLPVAQSVVDYAKKTAMASGDPRIVQRVVGLIHAQGVADGLRGAAPREVDAAIQGLTAKANANGADEALATTVLAARKFKENMNGALAHDPLMWAQQQGVVNLAPLQLNGTDQPVAFSQRVQQARAVSQRYGVPVSPLTQAEAETLKTRLAPDQDVNSRLSTLQQVVHGFGADAVPVLGKIGASDAALANAGTLLASGPAHAGTARDVLTGQALLADKSNSNLRPSGTALGYAGVPKMMSAFSFLPPQSRNAVLEGSSAIYAAQASRQGLGGDAAATGAGRELVQKSVQLAAGARFEADGSQWGGIGTYRRNSVLVPSGIKADGFEDLIHHFQPADLAHASVTGAPPVWEGGEAPGNLIHRTWVISGGNDVYGLSATDPSRGAVTPVMDKSGHPFRFRFGTALVAMQARTKAGD